MRSHQIDHKSKQLKGSKIGTPRIRNIQQQTDTLSAVTTRTCGEILNEHVCIVPCQMHHALFISIDRYLVLEEEIQIRYA